MHERFVLQEHFAGVLETAQSAAEECDRLVRAAEGAAAREQLERLARGQCRHVALAERLLEIVSE